MADLQEQRAAIQKEIESWESFLSKSISQGEKKSFIQGAELEIEALQNRLEKIDRTIQKDARKAERREVWKSYWRILKDFGQ